MSFIWNLKANMEVSRMGNGREWSKNWGHRRLTCLSLTCPSPPSDRPRWTSPCPTWTQANKSWFLKHQKQFGIFLGVGILYKKRPPPPQNLFSFLMPLSLDVWIYMTTAYLGVSITMFLLARSFKFASSEHIKIFLDWLHLSGRTLILVWMNPRNWRMSWLSTTASGTTGAV